jgi:aminoglycoside phosphotransferase (APT) family kinase protein
MLSDIENVVQLLEHEQALDDMADRLYAVHAVDAAMETAAVAAQLRWAEARAMAHIARLRDVWRAIEDRSDSESVAKALAAYRIDFPAVSP